ncbi:MAG: glutamine synthetase family protein [Acidimicrobiales bacterium]
MELKSEVGEEDDAAMRAELLKRVRDEAIRNVRLVVTDLYGVPRGKVVPVERFERALADGHPFAIPLLACNLWERHSPGERAYSEDIGYRNGVLRLDPSTFAVLPWTPATAHVLTDLYDEEGNVVATPRSVFRRVLEDARALRIEPVFGNELEFYVFRPQGGGDGFETIFGEQSWFSVNALGLAQEFVDTLQSTATTMGIRLYEIFSEHGAGQFEVNLEPATGVAAIDQLVALKIAIKEVARSLGLEATFMAKPTNRSETPPSGYHLHQSLLGVDGANLFYDPDAPERPLETGRHYIGGQIVHAAAMTALAAPTVTAYKRYQRGTWAPIQICWGVQNRTALLRYLPAGADSRIENRLGSSDANPYLLASAMVAAGVDGVRRRLEPGEPAEGNLFDDIRYERLPGCLVEALDALSGDEALSEALGATFARTYTELLRFDWQRYLNHVSDWEVAEYREML